MDAAGKTNRLYNAALYLIRSSGVRFPVRIVENPTGRSGDAIAIGDGLTLYEASGDALGKYRLVHVVLPAGASFESEEEEGGLLVESYSDALGAVRNSLIVFVQDACDEAIRKAKDDWRSSGFTFGGRKNPKPF